MVMQCLLSRILSLKVKVHWVRVQQGLSIAAEFYEPGLCWPLQESDGLLRYDTIVCI